MSSRFTVVACDFLEEAEVEAPILQDVADFVFAKASDESGLFPHLPNADALLLFHDVALLSDATFSRAPKLKGVVRGGVGYNNIDIAAAGKRGVLACNVPDYGTEEVADHAMMLLLSVVRRLLPSDKSVRDGGWTFRVAEETVRLRGRTVGIIGCGRIGTAFALRAKAFGLDVVFYDPNVPPGVEKAIGVRREFDLDAMLPQCHFVSIHSYLDDSSRHILNAKSIAKLRPGAVVVNTARGPCIDQIALMDALDSGQLSGAGIDVVEREPLDDERMRNHPRIVFTPHSAFYSRESFIEMRSKGAQELRRLLVGEKPRNLVNRHLLVNPRGPI